MNGQRQVNPITNQILMRMLQRRRAAAPGMSGAPVMPEHQPGQVLQPQALHGRQLGLLNAGGDFYNNLPVFMDLANQLRAGNAPNTPPAPGMYNPAAYDRIGEDWLSTIRQGSFADKFELPPDFTWLPLSGSGV